MKKTMKTLLLILLMSASAYCQTKENTSGNSLANNRNRQTPLVLKNPEPYQIVYETRPDLLKKKIIIAKQQDSTQIVSETRPDLLKKMAPKQDSSPANK
ncbi:MAG: hypothetical protein QM710_05700 [Flavobacterium sp.]